MADLPHTESWIDAVTRPMEEIPELCLAARQYLSSLADREDPAGLEEIGERFRSSNSAPPKQRSARRWSRSLVVGLAFGLLLAFGIPAGVRFFALHSFLFGSYSSDHEGLFGDPAYTNSLTDDQRFFIWGDRGQPNRKLAKEALWQSDPGNPGLFSDYLRAAEGEFNLPPEFLETSRRIDPGNAYFLLLAAAEKAEDSYKIRRSRTKPKSVLITKPAEFNEVLALIHEAASLSRFESYHEDLFLQRLAILPPARDVHSRLSRLSFAKLEAGRGASDIYTTIEVFEIQAATLAERQDRVGLGDLIRDWEVVAAWIVEDRQDPYRLYHAKSFINRGVLILLEASRKTGLTEEAGRLEKIDKAADRLEIDLEAQPPVVSILDSIYARASIIDSYASGWGVLNYQPSLDELRPGRLTDFSLLERGASWLTALAAFLMGCLALGFANLRGLLARRLGSRLERLLRPSDWLWIAGLGIALPLAWYLLITRLTPLGCRDWSLNWKSFQPLGTQLLAAGLFFIAAHLQVVRWRMTVRGKALHFGGQWRFMGWWGPASFALAIPVAGLVRYAGDLMLCTAVCLLVLGGFWILSIAVRALFGNHWLKVYRASVARALVPAYALSILVLISIVIPLTVSAERSWFASDELVGLSAETRGVGKIEHEFAKNLQARLREVLAAGQK